MQNPCQTSLREFNVSLRYFKILDDFPVSVKAMWQGGYRGRNPYKKHLAQVEQEVALQLSGGRSAAGQAASRISRPG